MKRAYFGQILRSRAPVPAIRTSLLLLVASSLLADCFAQTEPTTTVRVWGYGATDYLKVPPGLSGVTRITAGYGHILALKEDGTVVGWGANADGQASIPSGLSGIMALAGGALHSVALRNTGTLTAWGQDAYLQLDLPDGNDYVTVAAGAVHSLALTRDGTVIGWGDREYKQLNVPAGLTGVKAIAAGEYSSLAVRGNGTVAAWGMVRQAGGAPFEPMSVPAGLNEVVAVAAGESHFLALKQDGTVVAWGAGGPGKTGHPHYGQGIVPSGLSNVVAIAAGGFHNLCLKRHGTVVAWGFNEYGQCSGPASVSNVISIAGGFNFSAALVNTGPLAPVILSQPKTQTIEEGSSSDLRVWAQGAPPLRYQWMLQGSELRSGTNRILDLSQFRPLKAGPYAVIISNSFGSVTSSPAYLNAIPAVPRKALPKITLAGEPGSVLRLEWANTLESHGEWEELDTILLTAEPQQYYFDFSDLLRNQRFYRAWHSGVTNFRPELQIGLTTLIQLTGDVGKKVGIDAIERWGPTNDWVKVDTVLLTNTVQDYIDTNSSFSPSRLYRIVPVP